MKYDSFIFDLDDTLFDYRTTEIEAIKFACKQQGIIFSYKLLNEYDKANSTAKKSIQNFLDNIHEFRKKRIEVFFYNIQHNGDVSKFIEDYLKKSEKGIFINGADEVLEYIYSTYKAKIIVATNGTIVPRKNKLDNSTISSFIDAFFCSEVLGVSKPNIAFYKTIIDEMHISTNKLLVVGDRYDIDIIPALELDIETCWFNWKRKNTPQFNGSTYTIENITELKEII